MDGVNNLIKAIKADYCNRTSYDGSKTKTDVMLEMEEKFKNGILLRMVKNTLVYTLRQVINLQSGVVSQKRIVPVVK